MIPKNIYYPHRFSQYSSWLSVSNISIQKPRVSVITKYNLEGLLQAVWSCLVGLGTTGRVVLPGRPRGLIKTIRMLVSYQQEHNHHTQFTFISHNTQPSHTTHIHLTQQTSISNNTLPSHTTHFRLTQHTSFSHNTLPSHTTHFRLTQNTSVTHNKYPSHITPIISQNTLPSHATYFRLTQHKTFSHNTQLTHTIHNRLKQHTSVHTRITQ